MAGFKIEERIGQSLWGIHAGKVPQYESKLAKYKNKNVCDKMLQKHLSEILDIDE